MRDIATLVLFVGLCLLVGALGGWVTAAGVKDWYPMLAKPSFNPPNWVFGPVWTILYGMMGIAAWRVWRAAGTKSPEITLWAIQLAFNLAWSWVFFSLHLIGAALAEIAVLWLLVLATTILFWRQDHIAGLLLLPYLAWTGFATLLTQAIWRLNS